MTISSWRYRFVSGCSCTTASKCARRKGRAQFACTRCDGRIKEGDPNELVRVWGSQRAYTPKPDAWTVLTDVELKPVLAQSKKKNEATSASALKPGDVIPVHGSSGREDWKVIAISARPSVRKITAFAARQGFKREFEYDETEMVLTLSENASPGKTKREGTMRMLREHPELLHEATLSVHLDKHLKRRVTSAAAVQWATERVYVGTGAGGWFYQRDVSSNATWCGVAPWVWCWGSNRNWSSVLPKPGSVGSPRAVRLRALGRNVNISVV